MYKILVTGGSGFIGTNLIDDLRKIDIYEILNLDILKPKIDIQNQYWKDTDIRDREEFMTVVKDFNPDFVIHLAARTDLNGKEIRDYDASISGVTNLLDALEQCPNIKRAIFASSMYVCEPGYRPKNFEDYAPHTLYGEAKIETEKIIKGRNPKYTWSIIRPTSIWGPWFGEPYDKFFHVVLSHLYFHMGKRACKKTYGYIENSIYQIMSLLHAETERVNRGVFYIGDYEPYPIATWASEIASIEHIWIPRIPYFCFVIIGRLGDLLKKMGISFPMTSFRLHNMTTDNVQDLSPIQGIAPDLPVSRLEGTKVTLDWIHKYE